MWLGIEKHIEPNVAESKTTNRKNHRKSNQLEKEIC